MVTIKYWEFNKQPNSTARPDVKPGMATPVWNCEIKGNCSVIEPVVLLKISLLDNPVKYNYCYIVEWGRYYFINDWVYVSGLWEAHLSIDALASHRDSLRKTTQYILRSAAIGDSNVMDTLYPLTTEVDITIGSLAITSPPEWGQTEKIYQPFSSDHPGTYVIGVVGPGGTHGMVTYYAMELNAFFQFAYYLYNTPDYLDIDTTEISQGLQKALVNPLQYIVSLMWFPVDYSFMIGRVASVTNKVNFGWWSWNPGSNSVSQVAAEIKLQGRIPIGIHPQTYGAGGYFNKKPYSYRKLYIYPFGEYELPDICGDYDSASLIVYIDLATGQAKLQVYSGDNTQVPVITSYCAYGVNMPIAQVTSDVLGAGISLLGGISGAAQAIGNGVSGAVGNAMMGNIAGSVGSVIGGAISAATQVATGIASAVQEAAPTVQKTGSTGTRIDYENGSPAVKVENTFYRTTELDPRHRGMPYCGSGEISAFPGYLLIADPNTKDITGTATEREIIANYMQTGFYNED